MSGNFNIGGDFNVFDEWGNYVGKFKPEGGGFEGCLMMIVLIFAGILVFGVYIFVKATLIGLEGLITGDRKKAQLLLVPGLLVLMSLVIAAFLALPYMVAPIEVSGVRITNVGTTICDPGVYGGFNEYYYTVKNDSKVSVWLYPNSYTASDPGCPSYYPRVILRPGEEITIYMVASPFEVGVDVAPENLPHIQTTLYPPNK